MKQYCVINVDTAFAYLSEVQTGNVIVVPKEIIPFDLYIGAVLPPDLTMLEPFEI